MLGAGRGVQRGRMGIGLLRSFHAQPNLNLFRGRFFILPGFRRGLDDIPERHPAHRLVGLSAP